MCKISPAEDFSGKNALDSIIEEITEKRAENTKHFAISPYTNVAVDYGVPVHYKENGTWEEYDNTLEPTDGSAGAQARQHKNKKSDIGIWLSNFAKKNKMVRTQFGGRSVSWGYDGILHSEIHIPVTEQAQNKAVISKINQSAWYYDAFPGVDLEYLLTSVGVKETLVLKSAAAAKTYIAEYDTDGLTAKQIDPKRIDFVDEAGKEAFALVAPIMQDAKLVFGGELGLAILEQKNKKARIQLTLGEDWIMDPEREFPIRVDPGFITSQKYDSMDTSWISSGRPAEVLGRATENMSVGYEMNGYAKTRALVKLRELPVLSPGDTVVDAKLMLAETACLETMVIYAHRITSSWSPQTLCWNTGVSNDALTLDYETTDGLNLNLKARSWSITALMREWYAGTKPNYGILLRSPSEDSGRVNRALFSTGLSSIPSARPVFAVTYRHTFGLESYWTYHNQAFSTGVVARVNDSTGNLVVSAPLAATTGAILPAELSVTYNSNASYAEFRPGTSSHLTGYGWNASSDCRMDPVGNLPEMTAELAQALKAQGYEYALTDADGTIHYLMHSHDYVHKDEDGLGLTMTWDSSTNYYQVTAKDGTMTEFFTTGKIRRIVDTSGNTKWWQYEGPKLYNVMDGAGKGVSVRYSTEGSYTRINSAVDPGGRTAALTYSSACVTQIKNAGGETTAFQYTNFTIGTKVYRLISKITDCDGRYVTYGYETSASNLFKARVKEVKEYSSAGALGKSIQITYNTDNSTTFATTTGGKTITETLVFDNFGRTKCVLFQDGTAASYNYTNADSGTTPVGQIFQNNKVSQSGKSGVYVKNLLKNPLVSTSTEGWELSSGTTWETSSNALLGDKCLVSVSSSHTGIAYAYQELAAAPGETYTISAYMCAEGMTESDYEGARVWIDYYKDSAMIGATYGTAAKGNFSMSRVCCTGKVIPGANKIRCYFGIATAAGKVYMSAFQAEKSLVANDYSMLTNYDGKWNWTKANIVVPGDGVQPDGTIRITGTYNEHSWMYEDTPVMKVNPTFNISGMVKANSVATGADARTFNLELKMFYTDGTEKLFKFPFNYDATGWQYLSGQAKSLAADAEKTVRAVRSYIVYERNCNAAYFKDIMVTLDTSGTAYTYDGAGNLISAADNAKNNASFTFNSANELTKLTDTKNESYTYVYSPSNAHRLIATRSAIVGNGYVYGYDSVGNVVNTRMGVVNTAGTLNTAAPYLETSVGYNALKNRVTSVTDQRGKVVNYNVNNDTGLCSGMTLPNGALVSYEYYPDQRLKKVSAGGASVEYTYKNTNKLDKITRSGFSYQFNYNAYGAISNIAAGGHNLISYTYGANNGPVLIMTYGNGHTLEFEYDAYNRITGAYLNGTPWYTNVFNLNGMLARKTDHIRGTIRNFSYDAIGRVDLAYGGGVTCRYAYDTRSRVTKTFYEYGDTRFTLRYGYGANGRMGGTESAGNYNCYFRYDDLNRLTQKDFGTLQADIGYVTVSGNKTTDLVSVYSNSVNEAIKYYAQYTYDDMGYISRMQTTGGRTVDYQYDALGQLTYCKDSKLQSLIKYAYDANGNMLTQTHCNYTTGAESFRVTYRYEDATWKDLLTDFSGDVISYDTIGNPTSYRDSTLTWSCRRLDSIIQPNGTHISYAYDASGARTSKTVGGVKTEYGYADGRLLFQICGSEKAWFEYASDGEPLYMVYNGTRFIYLKNAQGDIIGMRNESTKKIVFYGYNEWGLLYYIDYEDGTSAMNDPAAKFNPLRYRGYVYDNETKFYYLNARYYDPQTTRFLNADNMMAGIGSLKEYNLFAYSFNSPISFADRSGNYPIEVGKESGKKDYSAVAKPSKKPTPNPEKNGSNSLPSTGAPNSSQTLPNPDGSPKQKRWYGPDGDKEWDRDFNHPGNMPFPHDHSWVDGKRSEDHLPPNPAYKFSWEPILGAGLVVVGVIGIIFVAADDVTGVGVANDFLFGPLGAGVGQGIKMIFG